MKHKKKKGQRAWEPYYCKHRESWVIPLTQGLEALIDECDVNYVKDYKWFANTVTPAKHTGRRRFTYPCARIEGSKRNYDYLHRFIMNPEKGFIVDHIDGNTLDNRRSNMRICNSRENQCNKQRHRSGKLVGASKKDGAFTSSIFIDGKQVYLGTFKTEYEAHQAYLEAYNDVVTKEKSAA